MFLAKWRWWAVFGISVIEIILKTFMKDVIWWFPCMVTFCISAPLKKVLGFSMVYATANNSLSIVDRITTVGCRGGYIRRCRVDGMTTRGKICRGMRFRRWKTVRWEVIVAKVRFIGHRCIFLRGLYRTVLWVKIGFQSVSVNWGAHGCFFLRYAT